MKPALGGISAKSLERGLIFHFRAAPSVPDIAKQAVAARRGSTSRVLGHPIKLDTFDQPRLAFDVASRLEYHHGADQE